MSRARTSRHRLTTAVTVALAVTVGTLTAAPTALAATGAVPAAAAATGEQQDVTALAPNSFVGGNGPSGFLSRHYAQATGTDYFWTRYADGVTTTLLRTGTYAGSVASDVVVRYEGTRFELYDMATGAEPVVIDIKSLGASVQFVRLAGSTLVLRVPRAGGGSDVHLVSKPGDTVVDRTVPGIPGDLVSWYDLSSPDTLLLHHTQEGTTTQRLALVDVATGKIVEDRVLTGAERGADASASATHLAWVEASGTTNAAIRVARRGHPEESTRVILPTAATPTVDLVGDDWVTYSVPGGTTATSRDPLHALTARSLTDGRTVKLLDTVDRVRADVDGGLFVQGATVEHGEGVYRIAPGPDGTPAATLVASTGRSLALTITDQNVPETVDLSTKGVALDWRFTGLGWTVATVELTHTASGRRQTLVRPLGASGEIRTSWSGTFDNGIAAYNGDYTWRMKLRPANGIAPAVERTGTLKVVGAQAPHGFSDSTSPDLLYREGGRLSLYDARQTFGAVRTGTLTETAVGSGWDAYDRIVTPGNIGGTEHSDLIARDRTGVLWSYAGTGEATAPFATRARVGGGWGGYAELTAGSDLTGDGRPDLVATDKSGDLWLYKGTGSVTTPFAARTKVGGGWGVYNKIVATGNIGGGPAGDLVARDTAGVLWLYLGKGDGTFAARTRIGSGWNRYGEIVAVGDANRDGRPDLLANGLMGGRDDSLALYPGTGDWRAPFGDRTNIATPPELSRRGKTLF
ncbi:FG-GAP repeat domain-containing protein [Streptomyces sp. NPDC056549]|uniref:FG-GAP repeat domain-containing protein n=1 Tax=Streptomyces sp. NPDC056549 TaxID=3345864 RepID=UPI003685FCF6